MKKNQNHSAEELKRIDDLLSGMKNEMQDDKTQNPFHTPDGYFDSLNAEVMKKLASIPDTESVSEVNPFKVPAGYFDTLPTIIQQRIIDIDARGFSLSRWITSALSRLSPGYTVALASVIIVAVMSTFYLTRTITVDYAAQQIPESEKLESVYLQQLDEYVLAQVYIEETSTVTESQDDGFESYLIDNDIDLNSLSEQL